MNGISIVIYDFDGTLVRSVKESIKVFCAQLAARGVAITPKLYRTLSLNWGMHFSEYRPRFFPQISEREVYEMFDAMRPRVVIEPFDDVGKIMRTLKMRGVDQYLLTNRPRLHTRELLARFGFRDHLTRAVSSDDLGWENSKPSSRGIDRILAPLEAIGHSRGEAVLVGDGYNVDRLCAENAGIRFLAANEENIVSVEQWNRAGVRSEDVLSSIRDLPAKLGFA